MTVDLAYGRAHFVSEQFQTLNTLTYEAQLRNTEAQCKDFHIAIKVREETFLALFVPVIKQLTHAAVRVIILPFTCYSYEFK
jgi:hypothetical protein